MQKIHGCKIKLMALAMALCLAYAGLAYAATVVNSDGSQTEVAADQIIDNEDGTYGTEDDCILEVQKVKFSADTDPAGGSGGTESGTESSDSTESTSGGTGTATVSHDTSSQKTNTVEKTVKNSNVYTEVTTEVGTNGWTTEVSKTDTWGFDDKGNYTIKNTVTTTVDKIGDFTNTLTEYEGTPACNPDEAINDLDKKNQEKIAEAIKNGATVTSVQNLDNVNGTDLVSVKLTYPDPENSDSNNPDTPNNSNNTDTPNNSNNTDTSSKNTTVTVEQYGKDTTVTFKTTSTGEEAEKERDAFDRAVGAIQRGDMTNVKQTTTKTVNGKEVTEYKVEVDGKEITLTDTDEGSGENYEIINLYYQWDCMAIENPEEFGNTGVWNLAEKSECGASKHVFQHSFSHWGTYKVKCDWYYNKQYWHMETFSGTDDNDNDYSYEERVDDELVGPIIENVNNWDVDVPLICIGCPPMRLCVGEGCDSDCANNANYVCDEDHNPMSKVNTTTYTELVK